MRPCDRAQLMEWFDGMLAPAQAAEVEAHLTVCADCRAEVDWLRTEAELMAQRRAAQPAIDPALWRKVSQRIHAPKQQPWWSMRPLVAVLGGVAAAAGLILLSGRGDVPSPGVDAPAAVAVAPSPHRPHRDARATLDRAEREYRDDLAVLEAEYKKHRARLPAATAARYDRSLERSRRTVDAASKVARDDVDGRLALFDGYQEYMRSLQVAVAELPRQGNP